MTLLSDASAQKTSSQALIALLLTAFVMRGPVTGVGPIAAEVVAAYGTTWSLYGLLAALPVAAFGLCSFFAPALQARLGLCGAASAALGLLFLGTALRFIANLAAFAGGMFLLGAGIALLNVLMPVVIKTRWPSPDATRAFGLDPHGGDGTSIHTDLYGRSLDAFVLACSGNEF